MSIIKAIFKNVTTPSSKVQTPWTQERLDDFRDMYAETAIVVAWASPGKFRRHHKMAQRTVRDRMPILAELLDILVSLHKDERYSGTSSAWYATLESIYLQWMGLEDPMDPHGNAATQRTLSKHLVRSAMPGLGIGLDKLMNLKHLAPRKKESN